MKRRVLILGAGICGLAAAWRLLAEDPLQEVVLLEQEDRPGGLARSLTLDGQVADLGPHRIFTEIPEVQAFIEDLAGDALETVDRQSRMWLRGGWIEYPPRAAEVARHLGIGTLAGAGMSYALHKAGSLVGASSGREESFESVMVDAFGPGLYKLLVGPYAEKVWKIPPTEIHADIARVRVSAGGLDQMVKKLLLGEQKGPVTAVKKFYYIAGGVEQLVLKLRAGVEARGGRIELVRRVVDIHPDDSSRPSVRAVNARTGAEETHTADVVLSTIPVSDLLGMLLLHRPAPDVEAVRSELRFIENFLVCLVVNRPRVSESQWLYFPEGDTIFNRGYEPGNFHASMRGGAAGERSMIVLEITCHRKDRTWGMTDESLVRETIAGMERTGLLRREEVTSTLVHRIPFTYPLYDLRYRDRLRAIFQYLGGFPTIASIGRQGMFLHNNMDHSIFMGFQAAEKVLAGTTPLAEAVYRDLPRFQAFRIVD